MDSERQRYRNAAIAAGLTVAFTGGIVVDRLFLVPGDKTKPTPSPSLRLPEPSHIRATTVPLSSANPNIEITFPPSFVPEASQTPTETESSSPSISELNINLGEETDISLHELGLNWTPDGHISYFTTPEGKRRYFITSNVSTYMIETDGQQGLRNKILSHEISVDYTSPALTPTGNFESTTDYKNGYAGITSILQTDQNNPMHIFAITHYEQRSGQDESGTYTASVGLVESFDGGSSWTDKGQIIKGRSPVAPGEKVSGAGQPAAIIKDGYAYVIYIEWNTGADQLYEAKMKINDDGSLGEVENITDENGQLKPVIPVPSGGGYAALPSLSYNGALGKYLCIFETAIGFYATTSSDLINWDTPKEFFDYKDHNGEPRGTDLSLGEEFITYPSLLSENQPIDSITDSSGELYYATRPVGLNSHNLKSVDFNLK